jgi:hypothetical protein
MPAREGMPMGLADEITTQVNSGRRSQIERVINQLEGEDLRDFITALHNVNIFTKKKTLEHNTNFDK